MTIDLDADLTFNRHEIAAAWQAFVDGRALPGAGPRQLILESWLRCQQYKLDPRGPLAPKLGDAEVNQIINAQNSLIRAAEETWRSLKESLVASNNLFVLADASGVILLVKGDKALVREAARRGTAVGHQWSEQASGTNAIGTAIAGNSPVLTRSEEHFCERAKVWDCAAAPVRDLGDDKLIGILDVTSAGDLSDQHTLALAVTVARQIEYTLHSQELAAAIQLQHWYRGLPSNRRRAAHLLVDRDGKILQASNELNLDSLLPEMRLTVDPQGKLLAPPNKAFKITKTSMYPGGEKQHTARWPGGVVNISLSSGDAEATDANRVNRGPFKSIVTASAAMFDLMRQAERMARTPTPVLVRGETGTGKELFAQAIHTISAQADGPFVAVNCATLTRELAASELFGYVKGAFTGASDKGHAGKFEQANDGTLFLDEIGELSLDVQAQLLRVLQEKKITRVGGTGEQAVNARLIAATHRDLDEEVAAGRFRQDLLYRLRVLSLTLPPLRERAADIPLICENFLLEMRNSFGLGRKRLSDDLLQHLQRYPWPGNVRELHGVIQHLYILSERPLLTIAELPLEYRDSRETRPAPNPKTLHGLQHLERNAILNAIDDANRNMSAAAKTLGISRSTLYRKMKSLDIER